MVNVNQSILKEISPEYSLEGLMLKLKLQYFGHLMGRADTLEKTLMLGKTELRRRRNNRGWGGWMASPTRWTWAWASSGSWWWTGKPGLLQSIGLQRAAHDWTTELNWIALSNLLFIWLIFEWEKYVLIYIDVHHGIYLTLFSLEDVSGRLRYLDIAINSSRLY